VGPAAGPGLHQLEHGLLPLAARDKVIEAPPVHYGEVDCKPHSFVLCVNVIPDGVYFNFARYIAPLLESIQKEYQLPDYRLADYGKGPGLFADALAQYLSSNPPQSTLVVDATTQEGRDALPTLERHASAIYRRF